MILIALILQIHSNNLSTLPILDLEVKENPRAFTAMENEAALPGYAMQNVGHGMGDVFFEAIPEWCVHEPLSFSVPRFRSEEDRPVQRSWSFGLA